MNKTVKIRARPKHCDWFANVGGKELHGDSPEYVMIALQAAGMGRSRVESQEYEYASVDDAMDYLKAAWLARVDEKQGLPTETLKLLPIFGGRVVSRWYCGNSEKVASFGRSMTAVAYKSRVWGILATVTLPGVPPNEQAVAKGALGIPMFAEFSGHASPTLLDALDAFMQCPDDLHRSRAEMVIRLDFGLEETVRSSGNRHF